MLLFVKDRQEMLQYELYERREMALNTARSEGFIEGIEEGRAEGIIEGIERGKEQGRAEGFIEGIEEGRAEGRKLVKLEVAKKLLASNAQESLIISVTGLSKEELEDLKSDMIKA